MVKLEEEKYDINQLVMAKDAEVNLTFSLLSFLCTKNM